jgi:hypothetical protein
MGMPCSANREATVVLPEPIPPVKPILNIQLQTSSIKVKQIDLIAPE